MSHNSGVDINIFQFNNSFWLHNVYTYQSGAPRVRTETEDARVSKEKSCATTASSENIFS